MTVTTIELKSLQAAIELASSEDLKEQLRKKFVELLLEDAKDRAAAAIDNIYPKDE